MSLKLRKESFFFFFPWNYAVPLWRGLMMKEDVFFLLLEEVQALLTWLSGGSQWQEASRAINPEGWVSVENGQPSQFSARLPFAFSFLFHPFVCMLITVIHMISSSSAIPFSKWVDVACLWSSFFLSHVHVFITCRQFWLAQIETPP